MEQSKIDTLRQLLDNRGLHLRFPDPLEGEFQQDYSLRYHSHMIISGLLGVLAILGCGVIDPFWMPEQSSELWQIWIMTAVPVLIVLMISKTRLQFVWGCIAAVVMLAIVNVGYVHLGDADLKMIVAVNFIAVSSAIFSLLGTFLVERSLRQNYLQSRLLSFENSDPGEANRRLQYMTAIDGLTQIANRRSLDTTLGTEWQRSMRKQEVAMSLY